MSHIQLTNGAVSGMQNGNAVQEPVVQVLEIKQIQAQSNNSAPVRYRLNISDGVHSHVAMLATKLNDLVNNNQLVVNSIIKVCEFICNDVQGKKVFIVLRCDVLGLHDAPIGNPQPIESGGQQQAPQQNNNNNNNNNGYNNNNNNNNNNSNNNNNNNNNGYQNNNNNGYNGNNNAPPSGGMGGPAVMPIKSLNPYQNKWTIKARVTNKGDVRTWNNAKGSGKLFSVDLLDDQGGEIHVTMFNQAVDQFFPIFEANRVYYVSRGSLKFANKKFTSVNNDYEMSLDQNSTVQLCQDEGNIPRMHFSFCKIADVQDVPEDTLIDVVGLVTRVEDTVTINTRAGNEIQKRTLGLMDQSKSAVDISLWGTLAENFPQNFDGVLVVKGAKVSNYNTKSLGTVSSSHVEMNPDLDEANALRGWFQANPNAASEAVSITTVYQSGGGGSRKGDPTKTIAQIREEQLGTVQADYFITKATISFIKHDSSPWYNACPSQECNKKVSQVSNGWYCEKCDREYQECQPRYILSVMALDHTGSQWLNCFNEVGEKILGRQAYDVSQMKEHNPQNYEQVFNDATFGAFKFKVRAKSETYNEEARTKCSILEANPINYSAESKELVSEISAYF